MTICIGIRCADGLVLCADSLESDGITKRHVAKIRELFRNEEWGIAVASAGDGDYAEDFTEQLSETLCDKQKFDENWLTATLRMAVLTTRKAYPKGELALLFGVFRKTANRTFSRIIRVLDGSAHPGPVHYWQPIGIGGHLSDFFLSNLYAPSIEVSEAMKLAVFCVSNAKEHVDGCGGRTVGWQWRLGDSQWHPQKCREIEKGLSLEDFKKNLSAYWKAISLGR